MASQPARGQFGLVSEVLMDSLVVQLSAAAALEAADSIDRLSLKRTVGWETVDLGV